MKLSLSLVKSEKQSLNDIEVLEKIRNSYQNINDDFLFSYNGSVYMDSIKLTKTTDQTMPSNSEEGCYYFDIGCMCIPINRCEEIYLIKK